MLCCRYCFSRGKKYDPSVMPIMLHKRTQQMSNTQPLICSCVKTHIDCSPGKTKNAPGCVAYSPKTNAPPSIASAQAFVKSNRSKLLPACIVRPIIVYETIFGFFGCSCRHKKQLHIHTNTHTRAQPESRAMLASFSSRSLLLHKDTSSKWATAAHLNS